MPKPSIKRPPPLAKLSSPRLIEIFPRTRLFGLLDKARQRPVVWIAAPAGAGKTTLVASYLAARKLKAVWYRLDVRDADPATFFYYLREAMAERFPTKRGNLPLLTPEYLAGLPVFTRNFFDTVFARMRAPAVLVFDNYQDLPDAAVLQGLLAEVLRAVPEGVTVMLLSREAPPSVFARLKVDRTLHTFATEELALTLAEARGIARLQKTPGLDDTTLAHLHEKVKGWTAGWVLLLERARSTTTTADDIAMSARQALFDYFATELFERAAPAVQQLLLKTAFLPQIPVAAAATVSGIAEAGKILADLEHRNYFTTRIASSEAIYQFHPLFREFLLSRANGELSGAERREVQQQAALLLCERAQYDDAAMLMLEASEWESLSRMIHAHAPTLVTQGRLATLESWLRPLPSAYLDNAPWLHLWHGVCRMPFDLAQARVHFEHTYRLFQQRQDAHGMYSAWTGIAESYFYAWDDYTGVDRWLDELIVVQRAHPLEQFPEIAPRLAAAALNVLSVARADRSELKVWERTAEDMLKSVRDARAAGPVALALASHYCFNGAMDKARLLETYIAALTEAPQANAFYRLASCATLVTIRRRSGDEDAAKRWLDMGTALCKQLGIRLMEAFFLAQRCYADKLNDYPAGVAASLEQMQPLVNPAQRINLAHYYYHAAWLAWRRDEFALAVEYAQKGQDLNDAVGAKFPLALNGVMLATVLVEKREYDQAMARIAKLDEYAERTGNTMIGFATDLVHAWSLLRQGRTSECAAVLKRCFATGREHRDSLIFIDWYPRVVGPLCQFALEHDIETEYVQELIRRRRLVLDQPPVHLDTWPWRIKLYTLGRFRAVINDKPLTFAGKAQKRPLELLKVLVALGGRDVPDDRVAEALWPEAEADAAGIALTTAIHRLRKLLGDEVVVRGEGRLTLDARYCWVDVWALDRTLVMLAEAYRESRLDAVRAATEKLFDLYGGEFLRNESERPWVLSTRERVRSRLLRQLEATGQYLASAGHAAEAAVSYQKALEIEPLAESLYRNLISLHLEQNRHPEALLVYKRCRNMLATHLGLAPSAETEALRRTIGANE